MTDILVIRWKSIGDVVFALPPVNVLRTRFPKARITFLVSRENVFVPEGFQAVDRVWSIDREALRSRRFLQGWLGTARLLSAVRGAGFSLVVDLQGYGETALFTRWSGAPERWGYQAGGLRRRAYTVSLGRPEGVHPVQGHLDLLSQAGLGVVLAENAFRVAPSMEARALRFLGERGISPGMLWAYLQPFTSAEAKNWPLERYLRLATSLRRGGCRVLWGGGERDMAAMRAAGVPGQELLSGVARPLVAAVLKHASVVVGGDTGFIHLAVALGRPVVMVGNRNMVLPWSPNGLPLRASTDSISDVRWEDVMDGVGGKLGGRWPAHVGTTRVPLHGR